MNITDVRIRKINDDGKMKAVVSITFDDEFVVHDIKIIEGQNGLFIAMPSRKMGEGDFRDIAHPLLSETRNKIKDAILPSTTKYLRKKMMRNDRFNHLSARSKPPPREALFPVLKRMYIQK